MEQPLHDACMRCHYPAGPSRRTSWSIRSGRGMKAGISTLLISLPTWTRVEQVGEGLSEQAPRKRQRRWRQRRPACGHHGTAA